MCDYPNREAAMVKVAEKVWCDPCLVPLVMALNNAGIPTVASCCGHGRRPSTVALADGREIIVARSFEEARAITSGFPDINAEREDSQPFDIEGPSHIGREAAAR